MSYKNAAFGGELKKQLALWLSAQIHVLSYADQTFEVVTTERDALGEIVYCFVEQLKDGYLISDDGRCLFKLDPAAEDEELWRSASEMAWTADFDLEGQHGVLSRQVAKTEIVPTIFELAQLQVALSYLAM